MNARTLAGYLAWGLFFGIAFGIFGHFRGCQKADHDHPMASETIEEVIPDGDKRKNDQGQIYQPQNDQAEALMQKQQAQKAKQQVLIWARGWNDDERTKVDEIFRRADELFDKGEYARAASAYQEAAATYTELDHRLHREFELRLGLASYERELESFLPGVLESTGGDAWTQVQRRIAVAKKGDNGEQIAYGFQSAIDLLKGIHRSSHLGFARQRLWAGKFDETADVLEHLRSCGTSENELLAAANSWQVERATCLQYVEEEGAATTNYELASGAQFLLQMISRTAVSSDTSNHLTEAIELAKQIDSPKASIEVLLCLTTELIVIGDMDRARTVLSVIKEKLKAIPDDQWKMVFSGQAAGLAMKVERPNTANAILGSLERRRVKPGGTAWGSKYNEIAEVIANAHSGNIKAILVERAKKPKRGEDRRTLESYADAYGAFCAARVGDHKTYALCSLRASSEIGALRGRATLLRTVLAHADAAMNNVKLATFGASQLGYFPNRVERWFSPSEMPTADTLVDQSTTFRQTLEAFDKARADLRAGKSRGEVVFHALRLGEAARIGALIALANGDRASHTGDANGEVSSSESPIGLAGRWKAELEQLTNEDEGDAESERSVALRIELARVRYLSESMDAGREALAPIFEQFLRLGIQHGVKLEDERRPSISQVSGDESVLRRILSRCLVVAEMQHDVGDRDGMLDTCLWAARAIDALPRKNNIESWPRWYCIRLDALLKDVIEISLVEAFRRVPQLPPESIRWESMRYYWAKDLGGAQAVCDRFWQAYQDRHKDYSSLVSLSSAEVALLALRANDTEVFESYRDRALSAAGQSENSRRAVRALLAEAEARQGRVSRAIEWLDDRDSIDDWTDVDELRVNVVLGLVDSLQVEAAEEVAEKIESPLMKMRAYRSLAKVAALDGKLLEWLERQTGQISRAAGLSAGVETALVE